MEWDEHEGELYGSSAYLIREALCGANGVFALTPPGVAALWRYRYEFDMSIILLKPKNFEVFSQNCEDRGTTSPEEQKRLYEKAMSLTLPPQIYHEVVTQDRTHDDLTKVLNIIGQLN
jgi:guanylate kinase